MNSQEAVNEISEVDFAIQRIAGLLRHGGGMLTSGDVARLRRMDPRRPDAAFFKLEGLVLEEVLPGEVRKRSELETSWAAIIVGLAHLGDLHTPGLRLGHALVDARFSELRFSRLLQADLDRLIDELPMLARFLTAKGVLVDWAQAAWLILTVGTAGEERTRRNVARDYYRSLASEQNQ